MKYYFYPVLLFFGLMMGCYTSSSDASGGPEDVQKFRLELLKKYMVGTFSSAEQAKADTNYYDISLNMCLLNEKEGEWFELYVEQALSSMPKRPYRQRVYRVAPLDSVQFVSDIYEIENDSLIVGACGNDSLLKKVGELSKNLKTGCGVTLSWKNDVFQGSTDGKNCLNSFGGATFATSEVRIDSLGIQSWDQGFDAQGVKVWGPNVTGYTFLRE